MSLRRAHMAWAGKMHLRGLTLVELLVVMALLSLLMLGLVSALRTMAQTEERIDGRLAQADEFRVTTAFVEEILGQISARKKGTPSTSGDSTFFFDGQTTSVSWVGVMPARHGVGGRYFFKLALEEFQGEATLVIRFAPWNDEPVFPAWEHAQARALVKGVTVFSLAYESWATGAENWVPSWQQSDALPEHVRIAVQTRGGEWPLWVIALRPLPQGGRGQGAFSLGP